MAGRTELVAYIADRVEGITKKQATAIVDAIVQDLTRQLARGERVQIPGFGSFSVSERAARSGRNPKTGGSIRIAASRNVRFKAGKDLKDLLHGSRPELLWCEAGSHYTSTWPCPAHS